MLTALLTRAQTGHGRRMEVSLFDAMGEWMGFPLYYADLRWRRSRRAPGPAMPAIAPYGPFAAGDGKVVYLAIQNEREWARFCAWCLKRLS